MHKVFHLVRAFFLAEANLNWISYAHIYIRLIYFPRQRYGFLLHAAVGSLPCRHDDCQGCRPGTELEAHRPFERWVMSLAY